MISAYYGTVFWLQKNTKAFIPNSRFSWLFLFFCFIDHIWYFIFLAAHKTIFSSPCKILFLKYCSFFICITFSIHIVFENIVLFDMIYIFHIILKVALPILTDCFPIFMPKYLDFIFRQVKWTFCCLLYLFHIKYICLLWLFILWFYFYHKDISKPGFSNKIIYIT